MTQEEAGRFWPVIKAYSEGKQIEVKDHKGVWSDIKCPTFDLDVDYYRIKKEPAYRPFKNENECWEEIVNHQPIGWIKSSTGALFNISEIGNSFIILARFGTSGYVTAIRDFVFADGTPFGIKEEK